MLLILHGMALRVNLIKNNLGLWTKINVLAAGGKGTSTVIQSRQTHQRSDNPRRDYETNTKTDIGMESKK